MISSSLSLAWARSRWQRGYTAVVCKQFSIFAGLQSLCGQNSIALRHGPTLFSLVVRRCPMTTLPHVQRSDYVKLAHKRPNKVPYNALYVSLQAFQPQASDEHGRQVGCQPSHITTRTSTQIMTACPWDTTVKCDKNDAPFRVLCE
jgi:hypothetical protein